MDRNEELRRMDPKRRKLFLQDMVDSASMQEILDLQEPYQTFVRKGVMARRDFRFVLRPGKQFKGDTPKVKDAYGGTWTLSKPREFDARDAIYLLNKYGPNASFPENRGLIKCGGRVGREEE